MGPEMSMILPCLAAYLLILGLCYWKPNAGRIVCGLFFIAMGLGVNMTIAFVAPDSFPALATGSQLAVYRWFFSTVVAAHPLLWTVPVGVVWEATAGVLMLSRGVYVKAGQIMALLFLIGITPFSFATLPNVIFILAFQYLLTKNFDRSLVDMIRRRPGHPPAGRQLA